MTLAEQADGIRSLLLGMTVAVLLQGAVETIDRHMGGEQ